MSTINPRIVDALTLLRQDFRRMVYEGAGPGGRSSGSGEFFVDYSNGQGPTLTKADVDYMAAQGWIVENPQCRHLYSRGNLP